MSARAARQYSGFGFSFQAMAQAATSGSAEEEMAAHARTIANLLEDNDFDATNVVAAFRMSTLVTNKTRQRILVTSESDYTIWFDSV